MNKPNIVLLLELILRLSYKPEEGSSMRVAQSIELSENEIKTLADAGSQELPARAAGCKSRRSSTRATMRPGKKSVLGRCANFISEGIPFILIGTTLLRRTKIGKSVVEPSNSKLYCLARS